MTNQNLIELYKDELITWDELQSGLKKNGYMLKTYNSLNYYLLPL